MDLEIKINLTAVIFLLLCMFARNILDDMQASKLAKGLVDIICIPVLIIFVASTFIIIWS